MRSANASATIARPLAARNAWWNAGTTLGHVREALLRRVNTKHSGDDRHAESCRDLPRDVEQ